MQTANDPPKQDEVILIVLSDTHFSHKPPLFRSNEPNWYHTQLDYINQVNEVVASNGYPPVAIVGDVVNHWKEPPELANFLLTYLFKVLAVPGQHDLPHHSYVDINRSVYYTLVQSGRLINLEPGSPYPIRGACLYGFPHGFPITPPNGEPDPFGINIALVHSYVWAQDAGFEGAPEDTFVSAWKKRLKGYRLAFFGDNHKRFMQKGNDLTIVNCGSFMRLHVDQIDYQPSIYLVRADGAVKRIPLDTSKDTNLTPNQCMKKAVECVLDLSELVEKLEELGHTGIDFLQAMQEYLKSEGIEENIQKIINRVMEKCRGN